MDKQRHIFLIGFSGSGKSTIGPLLAKRLKTRFYDIDTRIEKRCGKTITRIFRDDGENAFRQLESGVISDLLRQGRSATMIVALGGGAFQRRVNRETVRRHGVVVYLSCSIREIYRRMRSETDRPLLQVSCGTGETYRQAMLTKIKALLDRRRPTYALADIRVSTTSKSIGKTVAEIERKLRSHYACR